MNSSSARMDCSETMCKMSVAETWLGVAAVVVGVASAVVLRRAA